jgi:hypothetical protein
MALLILNDMRSGRVEHSTVIARGTKEELEKFVEAEVVETYMDGRWSKVFRAGGPLEWFNGFFEPHGQGIIEDPPSCIPHASELDAS